MRKLRFRTPYGDSFFIHDNGDIERDIASKPSGDWKLLGIQHVKKNWLIPLTDLLAGNIPEQLLYKNGNPQFTVVDLDHGTQREWGNTKYHGIEALYLC